MVLVRQQGIGELQELVLAALARAIFVQCIKIDGLANGQRSAVHRISTGEDLATLRRGLVAQRRRLAEAGLAEQNDKG